MIVVVCFYQFIYNCDGITVLIHAFITVIVSVYSFMYYKCDGGSVLLSINAFTIVMWNCSMFNVFILVISVMVVVYYDSSVV